MLYYYIAIGAFVAGLIVTILYRFTKIVTIDTILYAFESLLIFSLALILLFGQYSSPGYVSQDKYALLYTTGLTTFMDDAGAHTMTYLEFTSWGRIQNQSLNTAIGFNASNITIGYKTYSVQSMSSAFLVRVSTVPKAIIIDGETLTQDSSIVLNQSLDDKENSFIGTSMLLLLLLIIIPYVGKKENNKSKA